MASNSESALEIGVSQCGFCDHVYIDFKNRNLCVVAEKTIDDEISDLIKVQNNLIMKIDKLLENSGMARKTEELTNE